MNADESNSPKQLRSFLKSPQWRNPDLLDVIVMLTFIFIPASYTGSSSDEDDVNPREKDQVSFRMTHFIAFFNELHSSLGWDVDS